MKNIWLKLIILVSGTLALVGINASSAQATIQYNKQIAEVRETTPLYLKLGVDIYSNRDKQNNNMQLVQHGSHWSHSSHGSHGSHQSHYSSRYLRNKINQLVFQLAGWRGLKKG